MSQHRQGGFLIAKIHRTGGRIFARMLRQRGMAINPADGRVLFVLWEEGSITINEPAKGVSLTSRACLPISWVPKRRRDGRATAQWPSGSAV